MINPSTLWFCSTSMRGQGLMRTGWGCFLASSVPLGLITAAKTVAIANRSYFAPPLLQLLCLVILMPPPRHHNHHHHKHHHRYAATDASAGTSASNGSSYFFDCFSFNYSYNFCCHRHHHRHRHYDYHYTITTVSTTTTATNVVTGSSLLTARIHYPCACTFLLKALRGVPRQKTVALHIPKHLHPSHTPCNSLHSTYTTHIHHSIYTADIHHATVYTYTTR